MLKGKEETRRERDKSVKSPSTKVLEMTWVWSIGEVCQGTTARGNNMLSRMLQQ